MRTFTRASLVVCGLVASAAVAGGTAVAAETAQVTAKAGCTVRANHDTPILDAGFRQVGTLKKGKSRASSCGTSTIGTYKECGKTSNKIVLLAGNKDHYVPLSCVKHG